jgi:competence protein ComEC
MNSHPTPFGISRKAKNKASKCRVSKLGEITDKGAKHTYYFPSSHTLKARATVTLRSGLGTNTSSTLYWKKNIFIRNNEGDKAYLYNTQGKLVSTRNG